MHQESNLWYESKRSNHINAGRKAKPSDSLTTICAFNYSSAKQKFRNTFCIAIISKKHFPYYQTLNSRAI